MITFVLQNMRGNCEAAKKSGSFVFIRVLRVFRIFKLSKHSQVRPLPQKINCVLSLFAC